MFLNFLDNYLTTDVTIVWILLHPETKHNVHQQQSNAQINKDLFGVSFSELSGNKKHLETGFLQNKYKWKRLPVVDLDRYISSYQLSYN